ncbi:MAG: ankyrin repeat domain-containing protein [Ferruginibacter sp.]
MNIKDILLNVSTKYRAKGETRSEFSGITTSTTVTELQFETNEQGDVLNFKHDSPGYMKLDYFDIVELYNLSKNELVFTTEGTLFSNLHNAVYYGNLVNVKKSLNEGIDIDSRMPNGDTPLLMAINLKNNVIADFLMDAKANIESANFNGQTPLLICAGTGNMEMLQKLIAGNANLNQQDIIGQTALHLAVGENRFDVVKLLFTKKAGFFNSIFGTKINPNLQTDQGATPLHFAVGHGNVDMIPFLLEHGADATIKDKRGFNPYEDAKLNGKVGMASLFEKT